MAQMQSEQTRRYGQIVAEAWADPAFRQRLLTDPATVLRERGIEAPDGVQVRIVEDTEQIMHLVLPPMPAEAALSDRQLAQITGGVDNGGGTGKWPRGC
jgi:hypothetical protein